MAEKDFNKHSVPDDSAKLAEREELTEYVQNWLVIQDFEDFEAFLDEGLAAQMAEGLARENAGVQAHYERMHDLFSRMFEQVRLAHCEEYRRGSLTLHEQDRHLTALNRDLGSLVTYIVDAIRPIRREDMKMVP